MACADCTAVVWGLLQAIVSAMEGSSKFATKSGLVECAVEGNSLPAVAWYGPNGTAVTNHSSTGQISLEDTITGARVVGYIVKSRLTIDQGQIGNGYGMYRFSATNSMGTFNGHQIQLTKTEEIYLVTPSPYPVDSSGLFQDVSARVVLAATIGGALVLTLVAVCCCWHRLGCAKRNVRGESRPTSTEPSLDDSFDNDAPPSYEEVIEMDSDIGDMDDFPPEYELLREPPTAGLCTDEIQEDEHCV
ncbi:uncharacterized protein LOC119735305 [Patiria miniata]|uniref:Immunoglobulin V-set domain-containing protein n=1 Tax=Patiria miniata TaxID=46514 RepID=A0A914AMG8_PATMI|nr:uncharacterized protein LOC119735305 [Patiria miniata]